MDRFIEKDYWQYHDHWLGYCSNEIVQILPEKKYFEFGIKNVSGFLEYIKTREDIPYIFRNVNGLISIN